MSETLYVSSVLTEPGSFTQGIEGPAVDGEGNVYAVNYERQHTIGKVTPEGVCSVFVELPNGSVGNGIRFDSAGDMLIADYVNHNVLRVNMRTKAISVHAHEPAMNQPNDIAISGDDYVFASDPNWGESTGQIWRINPNGAVTLLEAGMGTTNGIEVSPDGRTLYVNETVQRRIWAYDLSPERTVAGKRLLIEFPDYGMDGMRCDIDGNLYVTRYGKGTIAILTPGGEVVREVELHGKSCSNLTFGGPDGRTVYVTMADNGNIETFRTDTPGLCWASWRR
jgi:sugar lactone lactonase YvrE